MWSRKMSSYKNTGELGMSLDFSMLIKLLEIDELGTDLKL